MDSRRSSAPGRRAAPFLSHPAHLALAAGLALSAMIIITASSASGADCQPSTINARVVADTWLDENSPFAAKGSDSILNVDGGSLNVDTGIASGRARALLRFSFPSAVPPGCVVESARLRLYAAEDSDGARVEVLRLTSPWTEGTTSWSNQPQATGAAARAWVRLGHLQVNVTAQVEEILAGAAAHGFLVRDAAEGTESAAGHGFYAREKGQHPAELVIRFGPPRSDEPPGAPAEPTSAAVICGQVLTESTLVTNDLTGCLGNGLVIGADRIIVDLGGHTIDGIGLGSGVLNDGHDHVTVRNGTLADFDYGVQLYPETFANRIEGLTLRLNQVAAVELFEVTESVVIGNTLDQNGGGIELLAGTSGTLVAGNRVTANGKDAIHIQDSNANRVEDNDVSGGGDLGIGLMRASENALLRNVVSANSDGGIEIRDGSHDNRVEGNTVTQSGDHGILVDLSDRIALIDNTSHGMSDSGITLGDANDGVIRGNDVRFNTGGIQVDGSSRNLIEANNASSTLGIGIELGGGSLENLVVANTANANGAQGIFIADSATDAAGVPIPGLGNLLENNTASGNLSDGIVTGKGGHTLTANGTRDNRGWGISAAPATIDGGLNVATGNGKSEQCIGVVCRPEWNPPETTITLGPPEETGSGSANFAFTGSDDTSPASALRFGCSLDGAAFTACTSGRSYSGLSAGMHTFRVRATDGAGNTDPSPATHSWSIDLTPPNTQLTNRPPDPSNAASGSLGFGGTDNVTAATALRFECRLDAQADAAWASCSTSHGYAGLSEGAHRFEVRAIDRAGNVDPSPASHDWTVDTIPPVVRLDARPPDRTNATSAAFTFSADEDAVFGCALDADAPAACDAGTAEYDGLAEGSHTFAVTATDAAGNASGAMDYTWTVDLTPPDAAIVSGPDDPTKSTAGRFVFGASETATFACALDSDAPEACTSPQAFSGLAEGEHTFTVTATDEAGNVGAAASYSWTIDVTAPVVTLGEERPSDPTNETSAAFSFSANEDSTFSCVLDSGDSVACNSGSASYDGLAEGQHSFTVTAMDAAGNVSAATTYSWAIDVTAPLITLGDERPTDPTNDTTARFAFSANEDASFSCALDGGDPAACADGTARYDGLGEGPHTFAVTATDAAGNAGAAASHTWTIDLSAPVVTLGEGLPADPTSDTTARFTFSATEEASFSCRLDDGDPAPCTSPVEYRDLTEGEHTFAVTATDPSRNVGGPATYAWTIEAADPDPTDTTPPETAIGERPTDPTNSTTATFTFSGSDDVSEPSALSFECRLDSAAETTWGACTSPKEYIGLASGRHTFEVRAVDEAGNADQSPDTYIWSIDAIAPETQIDSGPSASTQNGSATFTFSGTDDSTPPSALSFRCALDDAAFAPCASPATYANLADGTHVFRVSAIDGAGNVDADAASRSWVVDRGPPDTTLGARPASPTNQTSATFTFSGTDALGQPSALRFECRRDGAAFVACPSPQTYTGLTAGAHTFEVRAIDPAGNTDASPASHAWTIDTSAPNTTINSGPTGTVTTGDATFTFSSSESGSGFQCSLDSTTAYTACSSPHSYSGLAAGSHTFRVRAIDAAGNVDPTPASRAWTIQADTTAPNTTINSGPSGTVTSRDATFGFTSSESGSRFECSLDSTTAYVACSSPHSYSGLSDGSHTFRVRAIDAAGNVDQTPAARTWTIETITGCRTVTVTAAADAWIEENSASNNKGSDSILKVRSQGPSDNFRALVRFDLPAVPAGCLLESSTLQLYAASGVTGRTLQVLPLSAAWTESGVTWANQPGATGSAAETASGPGTREWTVTQQVAAMYSSTNHGFLIRDRVESGSGAEQQFHSREKGESPPVLILRYVADGS